MKVHKLIMKLLLRMEYTVGYRRVARLMRSEDLSVAVKRARQTTKSVGDMHPWVNRVENLDLY